MRTRVKGYGTGNIIGRNVEKLRRAQGISQKDFIARLQVDGTDINPSSFSKLEGQTRTVTDKEVLAIAKVLDVPIEALFEEQS